MPFFGNSLTAYENFMLAMQAADMKKNEFLAIITVTDWSNDITRPWITNGAKDAGKLAAFSRSIIVCF